MVDQLQQLRDSKIVLFGLPKGRKGFFFFIFILKK